MTYKFRRGKSDLRMKAKKAVELTTLVQEGKCTTCKGLGTEIRFYAGRRDKVTCRFCAGTGRLDVAEGAAISGEKN